MRYLEKNIKIACSVVCLSALWLAFNGCNKQDDGSDVATVDNFANGDAASFKLNNCMPQNDKSIYGISEKEHLALVKGWLDQHQSYIVSSDAGTFEGVKDDLEEVLLSTPVAISKAFFDIWKAKIYLSSDVSNLVNEIADGSKAEKGISQPFAAWTTKGKHNENGVALGAGELSSGDDVKTAVTLKQAIHHGMLRAMAYYYFSRILDDKNAVADDGKQQLNDLTDDKGKGHKMVVAFLDDVKNVNGAKDFTNEAKQNGFRKNLYVEVIDSLFCSASTRSSFKVVFPKLYDAYFAP